MTEPKYKPILFTAPMVRAILEGRKTQTRRIDTVKTKTSYPYGHPGDRLWVRENFAAPHKYDGMPPRLIPADANFYYPATEHIGGLMIRPSMFMPRWASRITLEVTGVLAERLQDISEDDAYKEGAKQGYDYPLTVDQKYVNSIEFFSRIWNSIHGPGAWEKNPWVWVVEFKRVEGK